MLQAPRRCLQALRSCEDACEEQPLHWSAKQTLAMIQLCSTSVAANPDADVSTLKPELKQALDDFVAQNKIVLFMKGTQQVNFDNSCGW